MSENDRAKLEAIRSRRLEAQSAGHRSTHS